MNLKGEQLDAVMRSAGARLKWSALLAASCRWVVICLGLWLGLFLADNLLGLPVGLRLPLALGGVGFSLVQLFRRVLRPAWRSQSPERTALLLEQRYGIQENILINAIQLKRRQLRPEEQIFVDQTQALSGEFVNRVNLRELWDWRSLRKWGGAALVTLLLWVAFIVLFPRQFGAAAERYAMPLGDTPPAGRALLKMSPDADVLVAEGANLDISLEVRLPEGQTLSKPPVIVCQERSSFVQPVQTAGENLVMTAADKKFVHSFANVQTAFAFRVFAGDSFTRSIQVKVLPLPQLKDGKFSITPPAYTGLKPQTVAGPPAPISVLAGSGLEISFKVQPDVASATWSVAGVSQALTNTAGIWKTTALITNGGAYEINVRCQGDSEPVSLARGDLRLLVDNPPEVDFVTDDRNRVVQFGQILSIDVAARDDFGLADVFIVSRPVEKEDAVKVVKRWSYMGPPGNPGPIRETLKLTVDPQIFESGGTYYLEAQANDFRPGGQPSRSRPIVLRVRSAQDMALNEGDPLQPAFAELKLAIAAQDKAVRMTVNVKTYLDEILGKKSLADQAMSIGAEQNDAVNHGRQAVLLFDAQPDGKTFSAQLSPIVFKEMSLVQTDLRVLPKLAKADLAGRVGEIESRQENILSRLLNLLGQVANARAEKLNAVLDGKQDKQAPMTALEEKKELLDDLKKFVAAQERLLEKSRTLADKVPEDLTQEQKNIEGELAREEGKWAKFLEEKLTDFSKLPQQDFSDASLAQELNSVYQEVKLAANALTQKNIELAVPMEQSGLENAQKLENHLEKWLPNAPDNIKWIMEEPPTANDVPLAELPKELEDLVGELLDKEDSMTPEIEDVTSSWMDSLDKGAGWGAGDGPISDMSATGVTGNQLPNKNEVGGRSGEGRTGRSHGQMVSDTAEGKKGRETPTRLDPGAFEQGNVKDSAKNDEGGATGGGKVSGFAGEGLRGPTAPGSAQKMPRLAEQQAKIRQQAEALALQLRKYHISSGALETSVQAMNQVEQKARKNDGIGVRRAFSQAVNALGEAKKTVDQQVSVRREQDKLPAWMRAEIRSGVQDGVPKGYEEMAGEYFRALAEKGKP